MPISRPVVVTLAALSAICVAALCHGVRNSEPAPAVTTAPAEPVLPLDSYQLSRRDVHTIEAAEDILILACMRKQGLAWRMLPEPGAEEADSRHTRRYGIMDAGAAARHGYHLPPLSPNQARREAVWQAREKLPSRERLAAYGAKGVSGGCRGQARPRATGGVPPNWMNVLNKHSSQAFAAAQRAPEVVAVIQKWSACMAEAGHRYRDPFAASGDPTWWRSERPSARERSVAQTDVRCKEKVGLVSVWVQADRRAQLDTIREHPEDFRMLAASKSASLNAAHTILRSSRSSAADRSPQAQR
ncbi:hypothetical protein [Nonomuraea sp. NPDC050202]|uniref:hypothetical protein n=1 Tax=Nonomuraea sp. NPDC050202 TaxID=3155035 RepID=UPI0033E279C4